MRLLVEISGLNLERMLRVAPGEGLALGGARRIDERTMRCFVPVWQRKALCALCERYGWELREVRAGWPVRSARFLFSRRMLAIGAALGVALVFLSSQLVLAVRIDGAQEHIAEVRRVLEEEGVAPGRFKAALSIDAIESALALRLPGLSFAGVRYAGSTLVVECERAREGEDLSIAGSLLDIVASEPGVVTRLSVQSGTPLVKPGQAVRAGQVLVRGEERTQGGQTRAVKAQAQVLARVWSRADARVSLSKTQTVETGDVRTRVTLVTPWSERVVSDAQPFDSQDTSVYTEPVVGLYLPVYRRIETFAETIETTVTRDADEASAQAQGAAEALAKIKCPPDAQILDKWTEYSMINEGFVCATVILEYERDIAARAGN